MSEASLSPIERYYHFHLDNFFFFFKFFLHYIALVGAPIGRLRMLEPIHLRAPSWELIHFSPS